jgi:hypothetical protein
MTSVEELNSGLAARWVYGIQCGQFIKVGVAKSIDKRLNDMRALNPHPLTVIFRRRMKAAFYCERKMHSVLREKSIGREWFEVSPEEVKAAGIIGIAHAKDVIRQWEVIAKQWRISSAQAAIERRKARESNEL